MKFLPYALFAAAALTSACATATRGETEQVVFLSEPPGAKMETTTGLSCTTPCTIEIPRRDTFTAKFTLDGEVEQVFVDTEVPDEVAGTTAANILLTPIILIPVAVAVDAASGANLNHTPNPVMVEFKSLLAREEDIEGTAVGTGVSAETSAATNEGDRTFKLDNSVAATASSVVAAAPAVEPEPEPNNEVWVDVTVDTSGGGYYSACTQYGAAPVRLPLDGSVNWHRISMQSGSGISLFARVGNSASKTVIEFRQGDKGQPRGDILRVPMPSLDDGGSASMYTDQKAPAPLHVCGPFAIYVDVVPAPGPA